MLLWKRCEKSEVVTLYTYYLQITMFFVKPVRERIGIVEKRKKSENQRTKIRVQDKDHPVPTLRSPENSNHQLKFFKITWAKYRKPERGRVAKDNMWMNQSKISTLEITPKRYFQNKRKNLQVNGKVKLLENVI